MTDFEQKIRDTDMYSHEINKADAIRILREAVEAEKGRIIAEIDIALGTHRAMQNYPLAHRERSIVRSFADRIFDKITTRDDDE